MDGGVGNKKEEEPRSSGKTPRDHRRTNIYTQNTRTPSVLYYISYNNNDEAENVYYGGTNTYKRNNL